MYNRIDISKKLSKFALLIPFLFFSYLAFLFFINIFGLNQRTELIISLIYCTAVISALILSTIYVKELNLLFLFSASYLIPFYYYYFGNKIITSYAHSDGISLLNKYLLLYALFFSLIWLFLKDVRVAGRALIVRYNNRLIFYSNAIICLLIAVFSKSGESIFASGGYGLSEIENIGGFAIGEYFIIFYFIAYKFSGDSLQQRIILFAIGILNILISFSFGLRNEFIQICILLFILFYKERKTLGLYFSLVLFAVYFSSLFSSFRSNPIDFLQRPLSETLALKSLFSSGGDFYISHQGDVVHSSCRIISFVDNDITTDKTRLTSFLLWFSSSLIPYKFLPAEANLASYMKEDYPSGGGGSPFAYFYFWLSYVGVFIGGTLVGLILRGYLKLVNSIYGIYFILVVATFPRWLSYSPINFIKMGFYGLVIYIFFVILNSSFKKRSKVIVASTK